VAATAQGKLGTESEFSGEWQQVADKAHGKDERSLGRFTARGALLGLPPLQSQAGNLSQVAAKGHRHPLT